MSEFDSLKEPLETWALAKQELISSLPPLDTDLEELEGQRHQLEALLEDIQSQKDQVDKIDKLSDQFSQDREVPSFNYT